MEPVKTCATCRHSMVGRRDPMDWWKRRLCAHPGLVDRVEGRPLYEAVEARSKERECGPAGTLWEPVDVVVKTGKMTDAEIDALKRPGAWITTDPHQNRLGPGKIMVYPDPVDAAVEAAHRTTAGHDLPQSFNHQATMTGARLKLERGERVDGFGVPALFSGDLPQGEGLKVEIRPAQLGTMAPREEGGTVVIDPGMLPRKPSKRARRRGGA